jgi:argininosuccinate lyase
LTAAVMGRLTRPAHAVLSELLYQPQLAADRQVVLPYLLRIDAAHVVMLSHRRLLAREVAARLLAVNDALSRSLAAGEDVLGSPATHRGLYFLYEQIYVSRLGPDVGGAAHMARSRNDINAAVTRMRLRDALVRLLSDDHDLLEAIERLAGGHLETVMCGFTHLQPAQPTTLGHYLAGVLSELVRSAEWLQRALRALDDSPMGAAAGFGTSLPIDREEVARLLGFAGVVANSVDAVASRDYLIEALSGLAMAGNTLTRLATDLQAWAGTAQGFVGWPDELVSTSSIMPQKRNPFVLENIRGQCILATGALVNVLAGMKNVPFSNSVEVSSEAAASVWPALEAGCKALRLTRVLVERLQVFPERMRAFLRGAQTTMTAIAELLVSRQGLAFRTAHEALGRLARETEEPFPAREMKVRLETILEGLLGRSIDLDEAELERALDAEECVRAATFGGGPAPGAVRAQLRGLAARRERLREDLDGFRLRLTEAEAFLRDATAEIRAVATGT